MQPPCKVFYQHSCGHAKPVQMCKSMQIFNPAYSTESFQITSSEDPVTNFDLLSSLSQGRTTVPRDQEQSGSTAWITNIKHLPRPQSNLRRVTQLQKLLRKRQPTGIGCIRGHVGKNSRSIWITLLSASGTVFHGTHAARAVARSSFLYQQTVRNALQRRMTNKQRQLRRVSPHSETSPRNTAVAVRMTPGSCSIHYIPGLNGNVWVSFCHPIMTLHCKMLA